MDKTVMVNNLIERLGASCRIVSRTLPQGNSKSVVSQLEVLADDHWLPIVMYEVHDEVSIRRELKPGNHWVTTSIEMPAARAQALLSDDLKANWEHYVSRVLTGPADMR